MSLGVCVVKGQIVDFSDGDVADGKGVRVETVVERRSFIASCQHVNNPIGIKQIGHSLLRSGCRAAPLSTSAGDERKEFIRVEITPTAYCRTGCFMGYFCFWCCWCRGDNSDRL